MKLDDIKLGYFYRINCTHEVENDDLEGELVKITEKTNPAYGYVGFTWKYTSGQTKIRWIMPSDLDPPDKNPK